MKRPRTAEEFYQELRATAPWWEHPPSEAETVFRTIAAKLAESEALWWKMLDMFQTDIERGAL